MNLQHLLTTPAQAIHMDKAREILTCLAARIVIPRAETRAMGLDLEKHHVKKLAEECTFSAELIAEIFNIDIGR